MADGLAALAIPASEAQLDKLLGYAELLRKWNRTFNLVSRQDVARLLERHLLDSVAPVSLLEGPRVMDLGSGAGLPGIPLAIMAPELEFTLCDRNERRMRFCSQVQRTLELDNVSIWVTDLKSASVPEALFNTVVARGVATAPRVWDMVKHILAPDGCVLVYASTQGGAEAPEAATDKQIEQAQIEQAQAAPPAHFADQQKDEIEISQHVFNIPNLAATHHVLRLARR